MSDQHDEVVRVASGDLVQIESYQQALADAGIEAKLAGDNLEGSFGTALPNSIELYVHEKDFARAEEILRKLEDGRTRREKRWLRLPWGSR